MYHGGNVISFSTLIFLAFDCAVLAITDLQVLNRITIDMMFSTPTVLHPSTTDKSYLSPQKKMHLFLENMYISRRIRLFSFKCHTNDYK